MIVELRLESAYDKEYTPDDIDYVIKRQLSGYDNANIIIEKTTTHSVVKVK